MLELLLSIAFATAPIQVPKELDCLAKNIYFEARNQPIEGQFAVAEVTLNRTQNSAYSRSICEVVKQKKQFSWYKPNAIPREKNAWMLAKTIAILSMNNRTSYVEGAEYFHNKSVKPYWSKHMKKVAQIGDHIFYKV